MRAGFAHHKGTINEANHLGFLFDHLGQSVFALFEAEKLLVANADFSICKTLALAPCHVVGNGAAFFLSNAGHDGDQQLALSIQRIDALFFKIYCNPAFLELADGSQGINRISGKAGDGLCENQVDLSIKGILYHAIEPFALFGVGAGDALVRIYLHK